MTDSPSPRKQAAQLKVSDSSGYVRPSINKSPEAVQARKLQSLELFAQGWKTADVARLMGLERSTLYHWDSNDPIYREQKQRIRRERDEDIAEDLEDIAVRMARGNADVTKDGKPVWAAVQGVLKVAAPDRWGSTVQHQHSGTVLHTMIPSAVRLSQLTSGDEDEGLIDVTATVAEEDDDDVSDDG